jgi:hypothetical protein
MASHVYHLKRDLGDSVMNGQKRWIADPNPWHPMTVAVDLKHLGKLGEELNECGSAASRCIIQGIDEAEPATGEVNRAWLEKEMADVIANIELCVEHFGLTISPERITMKKAHLSRWHTFAEEPNP